MKLQGSIIITALEGGGGERVSIAIEDKSSGLRIVELGLSYEDFGRMIARPTPVPCEIALHQSDNFGRQRENKTEIVPCTYAYSDDWLSFTAKLQKVVEPFEVDGWKADVDQSYNHHRRVDGGGYRVYFHRWVAKEGATE